MNKQNIADKFVNVTSQMVYNMTSQSRNLSLLSMETTSVKTWSTLTTEHIVTLEEARAKTRVEYSFFIMAALQVYGPN